MKSTIFIIISWQASYPCAFTQLVPNITSNQPPQLPVPKPCTVYNSSVRTFLTRSCSLQCAVKCVTFNLNIYITISSILEWCDIIRVLWSTFSLTSLCSSLPVMHVSILHVTAYVDLIQLHCLSNITFFITNLTQRRSLEVNGSSCSREFLCILCSPHVRCGGHKTTHLIHNLTKPDESNRTSAIIFL